MIFVALLKGYVIADTYTISSVVTAPLSVKTVRVNVIDLLTPVSIVDKY
jgi:hypothetical protein